MAIRGVSVVDTDESAAVQVVDSMAGVTMMTPSANKVAWMPMKINSVNIENHIENSTAELLDVSLLGLK